MALQYWASSKLCGVEQRAPPTFGKAAITLGIGPHSSVSVYFLWCLQRFDAVGCAAGRASGL